MKPRNTIKIQNGRLSALIDLNDGLNVYSIIRDTNELMYYDENRYLNQSTYGIPILYPTPNRVNKNKIVINDKEININMHGVLIHHEFRLLEKQPHYIVAIAEFNKDSKLYNQFPIESSFIVKIIIQNDSIKWDFTINNYDKKDLPFGLGIHPFFKKSFDSCYTNINKLMVMDSEQIPSGETTDISETDYRFDTNSELLHNIKVDDVFFNLDGIKTFLNYSFGKMVINTSSQFNHLVLYTDKNVDFACIEPQTCSTDCHNLYTKGYKKESNLQILKQNERWKGFVEFSFI